MRILFLTLMLLTYALPSFAIEAKHVGVDYGVHDEFHEIHGEVDKGYEEVQGLPQLNPEWYLSQIFWLAVTFAIMHLAFRFKILPDLSSVIERRREQIETDLSAAENLKEEAERVHNEYEVMLAAAREKSSALFARAEDKIKEKEQEEYSGFQGKASSIISETEEQIIKAKNAAIKDMNAVAAEIATIAAEKLVGVSTNQKNALSVVEDLGKKKAA